MPNFNSPFGPQMGLPQPQGGMATMPQRPAMPAGYSGAPQGGPFASQPTPMPPQNGAPGSMPPQAQGQGRPDNPGQQGFHLGQYIQQYRQANPQGGMDGFRSWMQQNNPQLLSQWGANGGHLPGMLQPGFGSQQPSSAGQTGFGNPTQSNLPDSLRQRVDEIRQNPQWAQWAQSRFGGQR